MSCVLKTVTFLVASKGLLPKEKLIKCLYLACKSLNIEIKDSQLIKNGSVIGTLNINTRIVITGVSNVSNQIETYEKIRKSFNEYSEIEQINYLDDLNREKQIESNNEYVSNLVLTKIKELDDKIELSKKAENRQRIDSCKALKEELRDAAFQKGYEVIEEDTSEGVQLQFIRRSY